MAESARPVIVGCEGRRLSAAERALLAEFRPFGLILFARNCDHPDQIRGLIADFRAAVDDAAAPVLIDQEGGRVARLGPPYWHDAPAARVFGEMAEADAASAREAVRLNARLIAHDLHDLGITVDCAPCLDVPMPGSHGVIGDRAFGRSPALIADLGAAMCDGLRAGGVLPVIKHVPGHGRACADSHERLPVVDAGLDELRAVDFVPFRALAGEALAMTAHIVYTAVDAGHPATQSPKVIAEVIRGEIGFEGALISDDLEMKALTGELGARAGAALSAGCDLVLQCSGDAAAAKAVLAPAPALEPAALSRLRDLFSPPAAGDFNAAEAKKRLDRALGRR